MLSCCCYGYELQSNTHYGVGYKPFSGQSRVWVALWQLGFLNMGIFGTRICICSLAILYTFKRERVVSCSGEPANVRDNILAETLADCYP